MSDNFARRLLKQLVGAGSLSVALGCSNGSSTTASNTLPPLPRAGPYPICPPEPDAGDELARESRPCCDHLYCYDPVRPGTDWV